MARKRRNEASYGLIIGGILVVIIIFSFNFYLSSQIRNLPQKEQMPMMGRAMSSMSFTEFDKIKAREFMDKNNDGKCDACGMPIDQCIASGMMQCSGMDPDATMGVLGSHHIHADWKVYVDGQAVDFSPYSHMQRMREGKGVSSFIHVDSGAPAPEKIGDVIHMHATGIPLKFFFESIGMKLAENCLETEGKKYCGIKLYVNGKENTEFGEYVFKDLDKILITDGKTEEQMKSITSFAEAH